MLSGAASVLRLAGACPSLGCAAHRRHRPSRKCWGEPPSQPLPMLLARLEQAGASAGLPGQLRQLLARLEALPGPSQAPAGRDDAVPDLAAARDLERIRLSLPQVGCSHAACTTAKSAAEMSMPVKTCGQCMVAKYCSHECQRAARGVHKLECARLAKASKK